MVLVQNKYKNTLVGVLITQITFITHSSHSCYVTLHIQVIRINSGNLSPQKTNSGFIIILYCYQIITFEMIFVHHCTHIQVPKSLFTCIVPVYKYCPSIQGFVQLLDRFRTRAKRKTTCIYQLST